MTTIVYDRRSGIFAADRQATSDQKFLMSKYRVIPNRGIASFCGLVDDYVAFCRWLEKTTWPENRPPEYLADDFSLPTFIDTDDESGFTGLVISKFGVPYIYGKNLIPVEKCCDDDEPFITIGSGGGYARAVLLAGGSVEEAIRIACHIDANSGLGWDIFNVKEKLREGSKPAKVAQKKTINS